MNASPAPASPKEPPEDPAAIRAEIDSTRKRMDETIDALGRRLQGRHLLDEVLHLIRKQQGNGNMTKFKNKLTDCTETAYHSVADTIKAHPVPTALVVGGLAWLVYEKTRARSGSVNGTWEQEYDDYQSLPPYADNFDPEPVPGPTIGPGGIADGGAALAGGSTASGGVGGVASGVKTSLAEGAAGARERLNRLGLAAREGGERLYRQGRERISTSVREHPLQTGLAFLALGFVAGLAMPAPRRLGRKLEPKARELRQRVGRAAHDMVDRGKHVMDRAVDAARDEARAQGLVPGGERGGKRAAQGAGAGAAGASAPASGGGDDVAFRASDQAMNVAPGPAGGATTDPEIPRGSAIGSLPAPSAGGLPK